MNSNASQQSPVSNLELSRSQVKLNKRFDTNMGQSFEASNDLSNDDVHLITMSKQSRIPIDRKLYCTIQTTRKSEETSVIQGSKHEKPNAVLISPRINTQEPKHQGFGYHKAVLPPQYQKMSKSKIRRNLKQ